VSTNAKHVGGVFLIVIAVLFLIAGAAAFHDRGSPALVGVGTLSVGALAMFFAFRFLTGED